VIRQSVDAVPPGRRCREASTQEGRTIMSPRELTSTRWPGRLYRNTILPPRVTTSCSMVTERVMTFSMHVMSCPLELGSFKQLQIKSLHTDS